MIRSRTPSISADVMSIRNTFGRSGADEMCSSLTTACCTRYTVMICITPSPNAASSAADGLPGRYRFAKPCRSDDGRLKPLRFNSSRSSASIPADASSSTSSTEISPRENSLPTTAESDSVVAIAVSPSRISSAATSCAAFFRSFLKAADTYGSSASSTARRKISTGRTLRISKSGGSVNSSVVSTPASSPVNTVRHCRCTVVSMFTSFASSHGNASCTPAPSATPSKPPSSPRHSVWIR